jgi:adenosylcobinamide-phosphate synthase
VESVIPLLFGFLLDQFLGDPRWLPHPVRWIGRLISVLENLLRKWFPDRLGGILLFILVTGLVGVVSWGALEMLAHFHPVVRVGVATIFVYYGLAARSLATETEAVMQFCATEDWQGAQKSLSQIVGRDTLGLTPEEIYRACIETVAENSADGIVAPLFYFALFGPVGMWVYKAINTLDSMVGYRNPRYEKFGWTSARADDLANYIPARLTFMLLSLAAFVTGQKGGQALRTGWRDARKHPSPNAGWPEAAMAGALGVQLGGPSTYEGQVFDKPRLGEAQQPLTLDKVRQAIRIMIVTAWLALALACSIGYLIHLTNCHFRGTNLVEGIQQLFISSLGSGAKVDD